MSPYLTPIAQVAMRTKHKNTNIAVVGHKVNLRIVYNMGIDISL